MKTSKSNFFWVGYSDLMTSLFFIMLTLYALTVGLMKYKQNATEEQLRKINEVPNATKALPEDYFEYQEKYKRFLLKRQIDFDVLSDIIPTKDHSYLNQVGSSIQNLIRHLSERYRNDNIKYLVIIEGMASKDAFAGNDILSYSRALSLKRLWTEQGINLDSTICELIVAGSGISGVGRYTGENEHLNQRFLIQIIPKIGKIEDL